MSRVLLLLLTLLSPMWALAARPVSFNLSTSRSFAPTEKPTLHLYAQNVDELEFRIYRVQNPGKFLAGLPDLHSFNNGNPWGPKERIDERTWLEKFHDWKHGLWFQVRRFFRGQFTAENRDRLRAKQAGLARRSRIVGVAEFAQIPLLNDRQLVARWRQELPPTYVSDSQELPIDPLPSGLYLIEATDGHYKAYTVLMVSRMAMVTRTAGGSVLAYCVDRVSGAGIAGVQVSSGLGPASATTDGDGIADLQLAVPKPAPDNFWLLATHGDDVAVVTPGGYALSGFQGGRWSSYIYTDRPVYRPSHVVHWKAILRAREQNHLALPKLAAIHVTIADQDDHALLDKDMPLSAAGNVYGDLSLPASATLGYYTIRLRNGPPSDNPDTEAGTGMFRVEDYRKPEYQVRVTPAKPRLLQGETMQVVIDARYFFGEPVANAKVKYRVYHSPHYWWDSGGGEGPGMDAGDAGDDNSLGYDAAQQSEQTGKLDANGKLTISVPTQYLTNPKFPADQDYTVEAGVTDQANREIAGRGRFLATRGTFRIQVEPASYAIRVGETALLNVTAVDYDNHPVQTRVHLQLITHKYANGATQSIRGAATDVTTDASGHAQGAIRVQTAGSTEVEASATTPEQRTVFASTYLWVMGGNEEGWGGQSQAVRIITDKKVYAPGDTAHISILSNVDNFHALVIATGDTVEFRKVMFSPGKSLTFDLPITTDAQPNLDVSVAFIRNDQLYQANQSIKVPPVQQQLQIDITPDKQIFQPQQTAGYQVFARDWQGKPVSADFSFGVVDEAIYSLYPDNSGDMVKKLYPDRYVYAAVESSLEYYFSGKAGLKSLQLATRSYHPQLAQVKPGNDVVQPRVRKAFPDTAYWSPSVHTDATGHAHITLTFPDSLTTWRTTVHAITLDSKAGSAINRVMVRKNIIVRMGTPRFLRQGDEVTIPVIVHNYLDEAKQVQLSLDINGLEPVSGAPQSITVPSKGEGTALWRVKASRIGTARLLAKALTNEESDALELTFPIEPIGVPRTLNTSGVIADNTAASTTIDFPANSDPSAHSLHLEIAPSIAGSLFSALGYLSSYPYGCTEQTMSSFLPDLMVSETLKKLNLAGLVSPADLQAKINAGLDRLNDFRHDDGGWGWWKDDASRVFMTAYVVSGLAQAKTAGYAKAETNLSGGVRYLQKQLVQHPRMIPDLRAYVVYALSLAGARDLGPSIEAVWSRRSDLSAEGLALTGLVMLRSGDSRSVQIAQMLESKAHREGTLVSWPSSYNPLLDVSDDNSAESTAFVLRFLTHADPKSPLLQGAAQWLVLNRNGGYWWNSTEQTAMVLFGLVDYLAASQELNADFDVDVTLNGASIGKRHFTAADAASGADLSVDVAAAQLHPGSNAVQVSKHGSGRAYWSVQGKYYSTEQKLYQQGTLSLNLTRDYYKLTPITKDGQIVYRLDPLKGPVVPGDTLAVHLAVNGSPTRYLLVEDPIPAGTEFVQQGDSYNILDQPSLWQYWYTRSEFYDDRAAFFATEASGRHESFYLLKVVNPGSYAISPANVQPMYQPGIQATSDLLHLQVDPAPAAEEEKK